MIQPTTMPSDGLADGPDFDDYAFADLYDRFTALWDGHDPRFTTWLADQLHTTPAGRAVDLGCGTGRHTIVLADRYHSVLAVDRAPAMVDLAATRRPRSNITYQARDALSVTARRDGLFDTVICVHTAHKLGPTSTVLPHLRSLVAPGGIAVIADIINPGDWTNPTYHEHRAFTYAQAAYRATGDPAHAVDTMSLMLHPRWSAMVRRDTPLTREQFHYAYTAAFPGAVIIDDLHPDMAAIAWRNPTPPAHLTTGYQP